LKPFKSSNRSTIPSRLEQLELFERFEHL